MTQKMDQEFM